MRAALRGLKAAHAWAADALKIPTEILVDLSAAAIARLKTLPPWLQERFGQLNPAAMRRVLDCASPCLVKIEEVRAYLENLAAEGVRVGERLLTTPEKVIETLGLPTSVDTSLILEKLGRSDLDVLGVIRRAHLTDKDFAKLRDFVPESRRSMNDVAAYDLFSHYLSALLPSKIGPHIAEFIEYHLTPQWPFG